MEIYWQQDDEGTLCISGYSREVPIPEYVQLLAASTAATRTNRNDRHGIVIHPSELRNQTSCEAYINVLKRIYTCIATHINTYWIELCKKIVR